MSVYFCQPLPHILAIADALTRVVIKLPLKLIPDHFHAHYYSQLSPSPSLHSLFHTVKMSDYEDDLDVGSEPPVIDPYETLGITSSATADEIKKSYRKAALKHHPGEPLK